MRCRITCSAVLRGDAAEVGGRVVPLARDVAVFVELLRDHVDLAGLDVDLDERFFGRVGMRLYAVTSAFASASSMISSEIPFLDRERRQRFEHLGILHAFSLARARGFFVLPGRGCGPHSNTVRALVMASYAISTALAVDLDDAGELARRRLDDAAAALGPLSVWNLIETVSPSAPGSARRGAARARARGLLTSRRNGPVIALAFEAARWLGSPP